MGPHRRAVAGRYHRPALRPLRRSLHPEPGRVSELHRPPGARRLLKRGGTSASRRIPTMNTSIRAVLFDLDGTLLDTAPDLVRVLNQLRIEQGREPLPYPTARAQVSHGSTGLIRLGFPDAGSDQQERLRRRLLDLYSQRLVEGTQLFDGCRQVLDALVTRRLGWGIVTNKPAFLTDPLLARLGLAE